MPLTEPGAGRCAGSVSRADARPSRSPLQLAVVKWLPPVDALAEAAFIATGADKPWGCCPDLRRIPPYSDLSGNLPSGCTYSTELRIARLWRQLNVFLEWNWKSGCLACCGASNRFSGAQSTLAALSLFLGLGDLVSTLRSSCW